MKLSRLTDNANCIPVEVTTMKELAQIITLANWAPSIFNNNYRKLDNFASTDLIGLDVDGGCSIDEARNLFEGYEHVIATTRNHQKEKNGVTCDRFRVILRLTSPITSARAYTSTYISLGVLFPFIDLACSDASRMFYQSVSVISIQSYGKTIQPVEKGAVAKSTVEFMSKGAEKGEWNTKLFKAAKDLQQQGFSYDETTALLKKPTGYLDSKDLSTIDSAYKSEPRHPARIEEPSETTAESWVGEWILNRKLDINYNEQITIDGVAMNFGQVEDRLLIDTANNGLKFSRELLFAALRIYYDAALLKIIDSVREKLEYAPLEENLVGKWVKAIEGQDNELTEAVIRHFIWSVKRKMNKKKVVYHLMPIMVGRSGGGKTEAIKRFLEPLFTLTTYKQLNIVNDERQLFNFSKYFVVFFDEMAHSAKADVECLKNIITSDVIAYRMMGKNKNAVGNNVSTFIGASNNDVQNLINDPTSVRRYYQINHQHDIDRAVINNLDYLSMWKSIDESQDAPIIPFLEKLAPVQEESRSVNLIEEWYSLECEKADGKGTQASELLREFNSWIKDNNLKASYRPNRFYKELAKIAEKSRTSEGVSYLIKVKNKYTVAI